MSGCLFCDIVSGQQPATIVVSNDRVVAFRDINPVAPVHVLVVPRRHITDASTLEAEDGADLAAVFTTAREVADKEGLTQPGRGYRLIFNVGPEALNSVPHLHAHVVGGRTMSWPPG